MSSKANAPTRKDDVSAELARPIVPVGQLVRQTYHAVGYHAGDLRRLGAMPLMLVTAVQTLYVFSPSTANLIFSLFGNLLATSVFAVGLNRLVLDNERPRGLGFSLGLREWRFFFMALLTVIPVFLLTLSLFGGGYLLSEWFHSEKLWHGAIIAGSIGSLLLASYVAVRFSFVFPAIALDQSLGLRQAYEHTKRQGFRIWLGLLLCLSPVMITTAILTATSLIYQTPSWVMEMVHALGAISALPLSIVFLALNYEHIVLGRIIDRQHVVTPRYSPRARGNPAWLRAVTGPLRWTSRLLRFAVLVSCEAVKTLGNSMARAFGPRKKKPAPPHHFKYRAQQQRAHHARQRSNSARPAAKKPSAAKPSNKARPPAPGRSTPPSQPVQPVNDVIIMPPSPPAAPEPKEVVVKDNSNDTASSIRMVVEMTGLDPKASQLVHLMAENLRHMDEKTIERVAGILSGKEAPPRESNVAPSQSYNEEQTTAIIHALLPSHAQRSRQSGARRNAQSLNDLVKNPVRQTG